LKKIYLGLAIHNHQPLGNFPWVFEQAYQQAYLPMVEALEAHPYVRLSLHYSGCLIDWLEQNHPEFFVRLAGLVDSKQVEIIGGAYYEPILPTIPDTDKLGQIAKMVNFVKRRFGARPSGLWLAERVWEPHLAKILAEAGVDWTLVDDNAFKSLGVGDKELFGCYLTEEQGLAIKVFPISKQLRYSIPWHDVEQVIGYLNSEASDEQDRIAILGDDGEKFGVWPGTYEHCWQKGWMDRFFTSLKDNQTWINTIQLGEYVRRFPPVGRIYLPCASYEEMMEWSLPADKSWEYTKLKRQLEEEGRQDIIQFMYSGLWRNFLVKYPEINRMYKKMLRVHGKVYDAHAAGKRDAGLNELWQAQCNCPYWHGVFGGIYLADIRASTYRYLIKAEGKAGKSTRKQLQSGKGSSSNQKKLGWQKFDFDDDGCEELLIDGEKFSLYISPGEGGSIFEWDVRSHDYNIFSTLARRPEAYHKVLTEPSVEQQTGSGDHVPSIHDLIRVKDKDAISHLVYDSYPRSSLIDHFFDSATNLEQFVRRSYIEYGDFTDQPYDCDIKKIKNRLEILLRRSGTLHIKSTGPSFEVEKRIVLAADRDSIRVTYRLKNAGNSPVQALFGSEWNINLLGGGHNKQAYYRLPGMTLEDSDLDSQSELKKIQKIILGNRNLGFELELKVKPETGLWRFPVESVSNSEGGIELIYQESCLVFLLPLDLAAGGTTEMSLDCRINKLVQ